MNLTDTQSAFLANLHAEALNDYERTDYNQRYMAINPEQGEYLYELIVQNNCKTIVEFGSSLGISTIYLAAAAKQTGGTVLATENMPIKAQHLQQNLVKADLSAQVKVLVGDAQETLKPLTTPIDFLFLDGQKNEYWEVLELLKPLLSTKSIILADNTETRFSKSFVARVKRAEDVDFEYIEWERSQMMRLYLTPKSR